MSVTGRCELCVSEEAVDGCDRCGRMVCDDHHDRPTGLCTECHREFGGDERDPLERSEEVDTYRF